MKKRKKFSFALVFILVILSSYNLISAKTYNCSIGDFDTEDRAEIKLHSKKIINGLSVGLLNSDESAIINRIAAKLLTDGQTFTLTGGTPSVDVELKTGIVNVSLVNYTDDILTIAVDGNQKVLELQEDEAVGSARVFVSSATGSYPGSATVEGIIGVKTVDLDNNDPTSIVEVNSIDFVLELFSASEDNAIVIVNRCEDEDADISEIETPIDEIENQPDSTNETNITSNSSSNINHVNQTTNITNENQNQIDTNLSNTELKERSAEYFFNVFFVGIIIFIFLIIAVFILKYFKVKKEEEDIKESIEITEQ